MMLRWFTRAAAALLLAMGMAASASGAEDGAGAFDRSFAGELLVAQPDMSDPRFAESVIYLVEHNADGAMGLVINKVIDTKPLADLLEAFGAETGDEPVAGSVPIHYGGPVQPELVFVLHTADYEGAGTTRLGDGMALTSRTGVLEAIAEGEGPGRSLLAMGYAGWGPGQLDRELARHDWGVAPAEKSLVFSDEPETLWEQAREKAGVPL